MECSFNCSTENVELYTFEAIGMKMRENGIKNEMDTLKGNLKKTYARIELEKQIRKSAQ